MAKDPAFLFYPNDWLGGTLGMTLEEKGAYLELIICQFNSGHMTSHMAGRMVGQLFGQIQDKFKKDENGLWYNERLDLEIEKRNSFINSRKNNLKGFNQHKKRAHMEGHMTSHMENENENIIKKGGVGENIKPPWAKNFHHWSPGIQYPFESEKFGRIWDQWLDYKKQRNLDDYTSISESEAINNLAYLSQGDLKKAEIMVKHSIARNWKSINPLDKKKEPFPEESTIKLNADEITKKNNSRPY